ncbi:hypothetical protein CPB83DRAFT_777515 [Crepidotus variabilis]|uniref:Transmembrane protein 53 n=1 Tax=Crepidotus variabilis TaxID=179855 RepID=A0A9P6E453_9AGAR|nr:hypothetical protein CPB83DRAFT_777515 [Crepidotus variabilis]
MTSKVVQDPGFVALGKGMYIKHPSEGASKVASASSVPPPTLILIFGWMGAAMPHILKYTKVYDDLYPSATQLLVRSEPSFFWTRDKTNRKNLRPLVEALQALGYLQSQKGEWKNEDALKRVLVHTFSNGGSCQFSLLHRVLASQKRKSVTPATSALVLDSNPAIGRLSGAFKAFSASQPNPILRTLIKLFVVFLGIYGYLTAHMIDGAPEFFAHMRQDLNANGSLGGLLGKKTKRLYLYSEADEMVPFEEVEIHIKDAKDAGFDVRTERFISSKHVAHARAEPERYWGAVQALWQAAVNGSQY